MCQWQRTKILSLIKKNVYLCIENIRREIAGSIFPGFVAQSVVFEIQKNMEWEGMHDI